MRVALLFIGTFLLTCHSVVSLSCAPCSKVKCSTPKNCKGGTVLGICNCCHVCAKVEGETCGGLWDMEGRCDAGLRCSVTDWRPEKYGDGTCKPDPCKPNQSTCSSLISLLERFNENRHHVTNPKGKQRARDFIESYFQYPLGLSTWTEEFKPDLVFPQYANGSNIIGMLPGTLAGSPNDRLFLIGAHYDTVRTTAHGANDNGSGVAVMLQVAKQIAMDFKNCSRSFSILFVAFDFEEWEDCNNTALYPKCACSKINCGSRAFVANLTGFYNGSLNSNGKIQGAIIMDTVMNYDDTPNSQVLPLSTGKLLPEVFNQIKADEFRGNFLSVVGRQVDDRALMDSFWYHYRNVKSGAAF